MSNLIEHLRADVEEAIEDLNDPRFDGYALRHSGFIDGLKHALALAEAEEAKLCAHRNSEDKPRLLPATHVSAVGNGWHSGLGWVWSGPTSKH